MAPFKFVHSALVALPVSMCVHDAEHAGNACLPPHLTSDLSEPDHFAYSDATYIFPAGAIVAPAIRTTRHADNTAVATTRRKVRA